MLIYNILTAKMVRQANKRISRKVWDFSSFSMHSFNVELNPDATKCNGVVVIDDIVQYFSYGGGLEGSVNGSTTTTAGKKSKTRESRNVFWEATCSVIQTIRMQPTMLRF